MTLNQYIEKLIKFRDSNEKNGKLKVIYASDDEGNNYDIVHHVATPCIYNDSEWVQFYDEGEFESKEKFIKKVNAVCIN